MSGRTALVTGAASGIGRALAIVMARRGMALALVDLDAPGLAETVQLIEDAREPGASQPIVSTHVLDLCDRAAIAALPAAVGTTHGRLDCLINNAGVALGGHFEQVAEADFDWLFDVNFFGTVQMTRAFLPMLRTGDDARIVNVSSLFGLIAPPGHTAYAASKFAVRGFSESLRHELAGSTVGVTIVLPGGVATAIVASARAPQGVPEAETLRQKQAFAKHLTMSPVQAAEAIVRGIERRRPRIIVGAGAKAVSVLERLLPSRHADLLFGAGRQSPAPRS